jgi:hypothetical protein
MKRLAILLCLLILSQICLAQGQIGLLEGIEQRIGLILLIASIVIIILMILMVFYLHNISDHLNWIRRIR